MRVTWLGCSVGHVASVGRFHGEPASADAGVADHDQRIGDQVIGDLVEVRQDNCLKGAGALVGPAEQDEARGKDRRVGEEFTEVGIGAGPSCSPTSSQARSSASAG